MNSDQRGEASEGEGDFLPQLPCEVKEGYTVQVEMWAGLGAGTQRKGDDGQRPEGKVPECFVQRQEDFNCDAKRL